MDSGQLWLYKGANLTAAMEYSCGFMHDVLWRTGGRNGQRRCVSTNVQRLEPGETLVALFTVYESNAATFRASLVVKDVTQLVPTNNECESAAAVDFGAPATSGNSVWSTLSAPYVFKGDSRMIGETYNVWFKFALDRAADVTFRVQNSLAQFNLTYIQFSNASQIANRVANADYFQLFQLCAPTDSDPQCVESVPPFARTVGEDLFVQLPAQCSGQAMKFVDGNFGYSSAINTYPTVHLPAGEYRISILQSSQRLYDNDDIVLFLGKTDYPKNNWPEQAEVFQFDLI